MRNGPSHRADLARRLRVSRTTVTNLVNDFVAADLMNAEDPGEGEAQLKHPISLSRRSGMIGSVVLRHDSCTSALGTWDGSFTKVESTELTAEMTAHDRLEIAHGQLLDIMDAHGIGAGDVHRIHLAINTQCDKTTGEVVTPSGHGLWDGSNPRTIAEGWDLGAVEVENSARLMGLAEHFALSAPRPEHILYVHMSWGVTLAHIVGGQLISGAHGGAGEIGHMTIDHRGLPCACGGRGCLMQYVSLGALQPRLEAVLSTSLATTADITEAWADDTPASRMIVSDVGEILGTALAGVCNLLNPTRIILGGEVAAAGEGLRSAVERSLLIHALPLNARSLQVTLGASQPDPSTVCMAGLALTRSHDAFRSEGLEAILERMPA